MPATVSHVLSATTPDDPTFEIRPSHWNSSHLMTLSAVGSEVSGAFGTNGNVTFTYDGTNINANAGTAAPSPVNISAGVTSNNLQTIVFSNSNGVSFGLSGSTITGTVATNYQSQGAYLTTAMQSDRGSDFVQATAGFNGTNVSGTIASNSISVSGLNQNVTAGNGGFAFQTLSFSNANGFSFGTSAGSAITGSYTVPTVTNSSWTVSDAVTSATVGRLAFTQANGITMTLSTSNNGNHTVFASHNGITSQSNQAATAANGSFTFQTISFSNVNGVSFATAAGSAIQASVNTSYRASNDAVGLNTAQTNVTWTVNSSGVSLNAAGYAGTGSSATNATFTLNSNGLQLSVGAGGGAAISASGNSVSNGTVVFSNSNGVSFGMAGSTITATVIPGAAAGIAALNNSNTTYTSGTVVLSEGGGAITIASGTGQHFNFSVPQTSSIVGTNGVSISTNGSTISVSGVPLYTALTYQNRQLGASSGVVPGQNSVWLAPMRLIAPVSASTGVHMISITGSVTSNQTDTVGLTWRGALYQNTSTGNVSRLDTIFTTSMAFTFWNSGTASVSYSYDVTSGSSAGSNLMTASVYGMRMLTFNIGSILDTGLYAWGFVQSTSSAGASSIMRSFNAVMDAPLSTLAQGFVGSATNASIGYGDAGTYKTTSGAMPASFLLGDIGQVNNMVPFIKMGAV